MDAYRPFSEDDAIVAAQDALSRAAGYAVAVLRHERLSGEERRNLILRASSVETNGASRPIIIKSTRAAGYDAAAEDAFESTGFVKEWAASRLLAERASRMGLGAALLAADTERGVLVFEDLGKKRPSLVSPLLHGTAEEAERALMAYARSLGRLHALTLGCRAEHTALIHAFFPSARVPQPGQNWVDLVARKASSLLGGVLPETEMERIAGRLQAPGPWLALVHRDPCPDNVLFQSEDEARLIDFEFSFPGHALLDAVYWRFGFPTCWCAGQVPEPVASRVDQAYRAVLAETAPIAADDDAFRTESTLICVAWLFSSLSWLLEPALRDDTKWGLASRRSRILHYMEVVVRMTSETGTFPALRDLVSVWLTELRARWAPAEPLAPYPAFRSDVS